MRETSLHSAARIIRKGGVVAYATEFCFGFGCDPFNRDAVQQLLRLKHRSWHKGLIVLAADIDQLAPYVSHIPARASATWPGPFTWLLSARSGLPAWITGRHERLAVRVTAHPQAAALCRAAGGAIISTSANRSGETPARTDREVRRRFGKLVYVLAGRVGNAPGPTPIRDAVTGESIRSG